jgi:hypothetical protein
VVESKLAGVSEQPNDSIFRVKEINQGQKPGLDTRSQKSPERNNTRRRVTGAGPPKNRIKKKSGDGRWLKKGGTSDQ